MALNKLEIGNRIRKIREEIFKENREDFGLRCDLSERLIGELERGHCLLQTSTLDKICLGTGIDADYILYGKNDNSNLSEKDFLDAIIKKATQNEIKMYHKIITTIKNYTTPKE